jgi:ABC-type antimicrobial peptide transport system permease subunit
MRTSTLLARNLAWFWRTNLAVIAGVATATAVLAGALLVGDSVRASLRDIALSRLGNAAYVITRDGFFREKLADALRDACPMIVAEGVAAHEPSGRRASKIQVYGVDERFWKFQAEPGAAPAGREVLLSSALAAELAAKPGDSILLRVPKPSAIPLESLHGRKENVGQTVRLTMRGAAPHEFSLRAQQGEVRAVYVPLGRLQRDLAEPGKVNTILTRSEPDLKGRYTLEDLGLRQRDDWTLESDSGMIPDSIAAAVQSAGAHPVFSYLANSIRTSERVTPYSLVTGLDTAPAPATDDGITLNEWTARDLAAKVGDAVVLDYFVWKSDGRLEPANALFHVASIVPISGIAADRHLAPEYPGITDSDSLHDWDPPFPIDLSRVRPVDEDYWKQYRATPKAFITLSRARELWASRFGSQTSIRLAGPVSVPPDGLTAAPVRAQALEAAHGSTDFGEYFIYFSFFLMVSALLLTGLFFKLGVEQRMREIGVLRALGFSFAKVRALFLLEGALLSIAGGAAGIVAAIAYGELILVGLRTWWVDAIGTRLISLHVSPLSLVYGAMAGAITGLAAIAWTLWRLYSSTPRALVAGGGAVTPRSWRFFAAGVAIAAAIVLMALVGQTAGFFGAGACLLIGALFLQSAWLNSRAAAIRSEITLGLRSATYRPGRSLLCIALIASATFVVVSLDAFQRPAPSAQTAGYPLMAESVIPLIHNPMTTAGHDALNLPDITGIQIVPFRLRPGDDASCLNLYQPRSPRILAPPARFRAWPRLDEQLPGGVIPAITDANSMTYVLHRKLNEDFTLDGVRFRIVEALEDSIFQSELIISESNFLHLYPDVAGFRFFLLKAPDAAVPTLEEALSDYGFDIQSASARLAGYHRVENTYLATFRALGGLGLLLGTVGLAAILMRNVLERRKELALLRAVGYRPRHVAAMVIAENLLLLVLGLATGTMCALIAVAPHGAHLPIVSIAALLAAVGITGIAASLAATRAALRSPLLAAIRSE